MVAEYRLHFARIQVDAGFFCVPDYTAMGSTTPLPMQLRFSPGFIGHMAIKRKKCATLW
jgi:hypothetical protein